MTGRQAPRDKPQRLHRLKRGRKVGADGIMSIELITVLLTAALQSILIIIALVMVYRMSQKQEADKAALYLQGRRIQEIMREMREELRK
jgi:hypothetical protein